MRKKCVWASDIAFNLVKVGKKLKLIKNMCNEHIDDYLGLCALQEITEDLLSDQIDALNESLKVINENVNKAQQSDLI